jgi:TnpA family transposase
MPVEFLSDEQVGAYGRFTGELSAAEVERFFYLDDADRNLIARRRSDHHRLGFAVQLGTVRAVGRFLEDPLDVPWPAVEFLAEQLEIGNASCVKKYVQRPQTPYEHAWEIRDRYGYRSFDDPGCAGAFARFLEGRAWTHVEGPVALFEQAAGWLRRNRVLLPGVTVLARQVAAARETAEARVYAALAAATRSVDPGLPERLANLLQVPDGSRVSERERLRRSPRRSSGPEMVKALQRTGTDPDRARLGRWATRLGRRAAVRRARSHHQRRPVAEVLRLQTRHDLAQRGQRPSRRHRADGGARHPRDSLFILDTLLNLDAGPKPEVVATDNASYSDMVFGVFAILNYRFAPRFADLPDQRYWRAALPEPLPANVGLSPEQQAIGGYGPLEPIARNTVNVAKITTQWPDMLRVAGSLVTSQVRAYDLLRMFDRDGHPTPLGQAFIEYGRIAKTLHLLALVDLVDGSYQRRMNRQLTVQESRHRLGRKICHGHRGQIRQAYLEGQEDQLAALGLVLNAVVLWNTRYLDAIVESLRGSGQPVRDEAVARLSPLGHAHLNCLGRYAFTTQPPAELRPLRDPNARDGEDDGEF